MTSAREQDIILGRLVAQFRRLARRVAGDPSALVPRDPAAALLACAVPVEALLQFNPLERLRASSPAALGDDPGTPAVEPPARRLGAPSPRSATGRSTPTGIGPRPALVRTPGALDAPDPQRQSPAAAGAARAQLPPSADAPAERREPRARAITTLAERRAAVRRGSNAHGQAPLSSHTLPSTQASPSSPSGASAAGARTDDGGTPARAPRSQAPTAEREVASRPAPAAVGRAAAPRGASPPAELPIRSSALGAPRHPAARVGRAAATDAAELSRCELERSAPRAAYGDTTPAPPPERGLGDARAALPSGATGAGQPPLGARLPRHERGAADFDAVRSRAEGARCDPADEFFEALYRGGVDLAWP
jgi:hypothetical protein